MEDYSYQTILNIAEIFAQHEVKNVVLSPGSRVAPLTIAFTHHPEIKAITISDERSAAFVGLGMAQQLRKPVVISCTSGTAALNYGPAIAEAFYQNIPLIVLTADRPPEWIDQQDGQTIRQQNIFENHIKASYQLPANYSHPDAKWHVNRIINEAINLSKNGVPGPVHVNLPFREPFYPKADQEIKFTSGRIIREEKNSGILLHKQWKTKAEVWKSYRKILVVAGQGRKDKSLNETLGKLHVPVVADIISNAFNAKNAIRHQDAFLANSNSNLTQLQPELLITFGNSVISKNLKLFLRKNPPKYHWHIQEEGNVADTFQCLTDIIRVQADYFFRELLNQNLEKESHHSFLETWKKEDEKIEKFHQNYFQNQTFSEFESVKSVLEDLPKNSNLHLANSMSVRYANFINLKENQETEVFANRGTSGIDGSSSTMIGHSLVSDKVQFLITGDLAFFYDRNAFWNNYLKKNIRILLLNNHGGTIFRMIEGPRKLKELEEYFVTRQNLDGESLANEFNFEYSIANSRADFQKQLPKFLSGEEGPKILEIQTDQATCQEVFLNYKAEVGKIIS
ncbi:2-succinyl-5-enolpyruvyl-6-hydroxy-3-cyclohexene-1-carboxylic-acid synthase [Flexithrix dorotheae]|uniref:2-succinyl-5-enolpyruvyl-6-hydroxy-3- cyclohexene-1-carboxylic-acid synthase n=1 Tax=Flexithrix dorotheae TaxID=70993 RepID=UPI00035CAE2A|nr:2-succinyl-5-enolpyruvyl-6-hydroxy-3-cyclohexene-1-carboxylic-acid synthase [Flexithrix dorotheae]